MTNKQGKSKPKAKVAAKKRARALRTAADDVIGSAYVSQSPDPRSSVETDHARAHEITKAIAEGRERLRRSPASKRDDPLRLATRMSLVFPEDKLGYERIIGTRDILQVTFLHQALEAARSVCRLRIRDATPGPPSFGTGFLVAPGVLLTNHHVLDSADTAHLSLAEFGAELNLNYVQCEPRIFNLLPDKLFVTASDLDFTFVAVNSVAHDGTPLADFRSLRLLRQTGKALNGEWATIIQHPGGETKQIVIRDNQVVVLPEAYQKRIGPAFVHYTSDTERGSSGSPVLNDQFEVLALHHKGVPEYNAAGEPLARDRKTVWTPELGEDQRSWIANEGVRISAIFKQLDRMAYASSHAVNLLALLENGEPRSIFSALSTGRVPARESIGEGGELEAAALARRKGKGYDPNFLGFEVPLPKPSKALEKQVQLLNADAQPKGSRAGELVYTHFSVVMHAKRRLAIFAAVNINGKNPGQPRVTPRWRPDGRIVREAQSLNELYEDNVLDKGHLVRRLDPSWGEQQEVDDAVTDTYHYANAAPQEHSFNDGLWGDVEDYILQMAAAGGHKISVFTGPVFDKSDRPYRANKPGGPWLIPSRFWKVIVYKKSDGTRAATGFVLDQSDQIVDLDEKMTPLPKAREVAKVHQQTIKAIEKLTSLSFGALATFDPLSDLESTRQVRRIVLPAQIIL